MKCKHNNCRITEYGTAYTEHWNQRGDWYHSSSLDNYTGKIDGKCGDCGLNKTYNRYAKSCPKWLLVKFNEAIKVDDL